MIYPDTSFLFSFYALDENSRAAVTAYESDRRRPILFTPWQRFEVRNSVRLAVHRLRRAQQTIPFQLGNVLRAIDADLSAGILRHQVPDWTETFRLAEDLSEQHTEQIGSASVDLWHVACARLLGADTFWTFDGDQLALARAVGFRQVPEL